MRKLLVAPMLLLVVTVPGLAGEVSTPGAVQPPPASATSTETTAIPSSLTTVILTLLTLLRG